MCLWEKKRRRRALRMYKGIIHTHTHNNKKKKGSLPVRTQASPKRAGWLGYHFGSPGTTFVCASWTAAAFLRCTPTALSSHPQSLFVHLLFFSFLASRCVFSFYRLFLCFRLRLLPSPPSTRELRKKFKRCQRTFHAFKPLHCCLSSLPCSPFYFSPLCMSQAACSQDDCSVYMLL